MFFLAVWRSVTKRPSNQWSHHRSHLDTLLCGQPVRVIRATGQRPESALRRMQNWPTVTTLISWLLCCGRAFCECISVAWVVVGWLDGLCAMQFFRFRLSCSFVPNVELQITRELPSIFCKLNVHAIKRQVFAREIIFSYNTERHKKM